MIKWSENYYDNRIGEDVNGKPLYLGDEVILGGVNGIAKIVYFPEIFRYYAQYQDGEQLDLKDFTIRRVGR